MSSRSTQEILSSSVGTLATIKVAGMALKGLEELSKPVKPKKYI